MLTIKQITEDKDAVIRGLEKKKFKGAREAIDQVLTTDNKRKTAQAELDSLLAEIKTLSKDIGAFMKNGEKVKAEEAKDKVSEIKVRTKELEEVMKNALDERTQLLYAIPNIPYDLVPEGQGAEDNVVVKTGGHDTVLPQNALPHCLTEIMPPTVVNAASGYGTGQLPDKEGQMYHCQEDDLYLIPTAEVPVTNIYRDVILEEKELPVKNCAYTQCFRREAGSYGKDVRGLNRLHGFSKIEIVRIDTPEHSAQSHQEMLDHVEGLLQKLELPYRILRLCGGDMSFTAAICYDFEVNRGWWESGPFLISTVIRLTACSVATEVQTRKFNFAIPSMDRLWLCPAFWLHYLRIFRLRKEYAFPRLYSLIWDVI